MICCVNKFQFNRVFLLNVSIRKMLTNMLSKYEITRPKSLLSVFKPVLPQRMEQTVTTLVPVSPPTLKIVTMLTAHVPATVAGRAPTVKLTSTNVPHNVPALTATVPTLMGHLPVDVMLDSLALPQMVLIAQVGLTLDT